MKNYSIYSLYDFVKKPALFTTWSAAHYSSGLLAKKFISSNKKARLLHILYEMKDLYISVIKKKNLNPNLPDEFIQNSILNSIGDQLCYELGLQTNIDIDLQVTTLILLTIGVIASPKLPNDPHWNFKIWYNRG